MSWFTDYFGFEEKSSYSANQAEFGLDGLYLCCDKSKYPRQYVGEFSTPTLSELKEKLGDDPASSVEPGCCLRFLHEAHPVGVEPLLFNPENNDAVFQAASQFNALEMVGPRVTPKQGVSRYISDPTQGPKCAMACPAALIYRNYLCQDGKGQGDVQIDCLADVGMVLGNDIDNRFWNMQNGYALPSTPNSFAELGEILRSSESIYLEAYNALRVAVHWDTSVKCPHTHRICQVFASALPVAYAKGVKTKDFETFAQLILDAAYDATLCVASILARKRGSRVKVYLTALGGGAFGNRAEWICRAISKALQLYKYSPLDVVLVHYGSVVRSQFLSSVPNIGTPLPEDEEKNQQREEEENRRKSITALLANQVVQRVAREE